MRILRTGLLLMAGLAVGRMLARKLAERGARDAEQPPPPTDPAPTTPPA